MKLIERIMLELAAVSVLALVVLITASIIARGVFHANVPDTIILVRELMIPSIILPLAAATANRSHIAVTFVTDAMSPAWRSRLVLFGWVVAMLAVMPLIYAAWRDFSHAWNRNSFYDGELQLPQWPMRFVFLAGLAAMWVRLALVFVADLREYLSTGTILEASHSGGEAL